MAIMDESIDGSAALPLGKNRAALAAITIALVSLAAATFLPYIAMVIAVIAVPFGIRGLAKAMSSGSRLLVIIAITVGIVGNVAAILLVAGMGSHS
jgi:hypothetical protein